MFACRPCSSGLSKCTRRSRDLLRCFNLDIYAEAGYKMFFRCFLASIRSKKSRSSVVGPMVIIRPSQRDIIDKGSSIHFMASEPKKNII